MLRHWCSDPFFLWNAWSFHWYRLPYNPRRAKSFFTWIIQIQHLYWSHNPGEALQVDVVVSLRSARKLDLLVCARNILWRSSCVHVCVLLLKHVVYIKWFVLQRDSEPKYTSGLCELFKGQLTEKQSAGALQQMTGRSSLRTAVKD